MADNTISSLLGILRTTFDSFIGSEDLEVQLNDWIKRLSPPSDKEIEDILSTMEKELEAADSRKAHSDTQKLLSQMLKETENWSLSIRSLLEKVDQLKQEWLEREQFSERGWQELSKDIDDVFAEEGSATGSAEWLRQLIAALDARKFDAATRIVNHDFRFSDNIHEAVNKLRSGIDNDKVDLAIVEALTQGNFFGWKTPIDNRQRSNLFLLSAWLIATTSAEAQDQLKQPADYLDKAILTDPSNAKAYAEKAGFLFSRGDIDLAYANAQRAITLSRDEPDGFLQLGIWAETNKRWTEANDYYVAGLNLMSLYSIEELDSPRSFFKPTGFFLTVAGETLHHHGKDESALRLLDEALNNEVQGELAYPEAKTYAVRSSVLKALRRPIPEIANASLEAGKRYYWSNQYEDSATWFRNASHVKNAPVDAGWYLADTEYLLALMQPKINKEQLSTAKQTWEQWYRTKGPPSYALSWAYLTRAYIEKAYAEEGNGWLALTYGERALIHNPWDATRWSTVSKLLCDVGLYQLALEAAEEALKIDSNHADGLDYKWVSLAELARYHEARDVLLQRQGLYPEGGYDAAFSALELLSGNPKEALRLAKQALESDPNNIFALRQKADALILLDKNKEALAVLNEMVKLHPASQENSLSQTIAATLIGETDRASDRLAIARKFTSLATDYHFYGAQLGLAINDWETAKSELQKLIFNASPLWINRLENTATMYIPLMPDSETYQGKRTELVQACIKELLPQRKKKLEKQIQTAHDELNDAMSKVDNEKARIALQTINGRHLIASGEFAAGAQIYRELYLIDEFKNEAKIGLTYAERGASTSGDLKELKKVLQVQVAASYKKQHDADFQLAAAYENAGELDKALSLFQSLFKTAKDSQVGVDAGAFAGDLLLRSRIFEGAYQQFKETFNAATSLNMKRYSDLLLIRAAVAAVAGNRSDTNVDLGLAIKAMVDLLKTDNSLALIPTDIVPNELVGYVREDKFRKLINLLDSISEEENPSEATLQAASEVFVSALNFEF